jgi:hypothetical protein
MDLSQKADTVIQNTIEYLQIFLNQICFILIYFNFILIY